jgi:hypothetical protein
LGSSIRSTDESTLSVLYSDVDVDVKVLSTHENIRESTPLNACQRPVIDVCGHSLTFSAAQTKVW